ncbi:hypothetical protein SH139x_003569 [Planctomycetaceae bacterium SH139]
MRYSLGFFGLLVGAVVCAPVNAQFSPRAGFSLRSPLLDIDVGPMVGMPFPGSGLGFAGGRFPIPAYPPQFAGPAGFPLPLPGYLPPFPGDFPPPGFAVPRGFRPAYADSRRGLGRVDVYVPGPSAFGPIVPIRPYDPLESRPPAPAFDVPSFDQVFPGQADIESLKPQADQQFENGGPAGSQPTDLLTQLAQLQQVLGNDQAAEAWIEYLQIEKLRQLARRLSGSQRLDALTGNAAIAEEAADFLLPFDAVVASEGLDWLSADPSFQTVRQTLKRLVGEQPGETGDEVPQTREPTPEALEELPAPAPDRVDAPDRGAAPPVKRVYRGEA